MTGVVNGTLMQANRLPFNCQSSNIRGPYALVVSLTSISLCCLLSWLLLLLSQSQDNQQQQQQQQPSERYTNRLLRSFLSSQTCLEAIQQVHNASIEELAGGYRVLLHLLHNSC
jgi:hypothetical protein